MPGLFSLRSALAGLWMAGLLGLAAPGPVQACGVCIDLPNATLADRILADRLVVLARPDPGNPFRFVPTQILQGRMDDPAMREPIPFLVDSVTRRRMADDPETAVLLSYGPRDTGPGDEGWARLLTVTPPRLPVIEAILMDGQDWDWGATTDAARFGFFADLLIRPDPALRRVALGEVTRAPYGLIRTLDAPIPLDDLQDGLNSPTQIPFAPLFVLLTGLLDTPAAQQFVQQNFSGALTHGSSRIDAWIVAGLELDSQAGLDRIRVRLQTGPAFAYDTQERIVTGLAVAATARPELRASVMALFQDMLSRSPGLAETLAYTSYTWRDWSLAPAFADLIAASPEMDHATRYILDIVVATAADDGATVAPPSGG